MKPPRLALFLDKDGVINLDHGYVCTPERTEFLDGIFDICRAAQHHGWLVIVITNQAGIARGLYSELQFQHYMGWMRNIFEARGARLDAVYHCPHHPMHGRGEYRRECNCRKPKPGLLWAAQRDWNIDLSRSLLLGDSATDIEAGEAAGVGHCLRVSTVAQTGSPLPKLDPAFVRDVGRLLETKSFPHDGPGARR